MKERLLIILAALVVLVAGSQPALPIPPRASTAHAIVLDGECHGGGQCSL